MKKHYFSLLFALLFFASNAQHLSNSDFENWKMANTGKEVPEFWTTDDTFNNVNHIFCVKEEDAYSGEYAFRLENYHATPNMCNASVIRLGESDPNFPEIKSIDFNERPKALAFYFKYRVSDPSPFEFYQGKAEIELLKLDETGENLEIVGSGIMHFNENIEEWTYAELPIEYISDETPDKLSVTFRNPCDPGNDVALSVDFVGLTGLNSTNTEDIALLGEINVFPNPSEGNFTIYNPTFENYPNLLVMNILGRKIHEEKLTSSSKKINIPDLPNGQYFYQISDGKTPVFTGKLLIQN